MRYLVVVVVGGCWWGKDTSASPPVPPPHVAVDAAPLDGLPEEPREVIARMTSFRDQMCACADRACADIVQEAMSKWSTETATRLGDRMPSHPSETEAMTKKMMELGTVYAECMAKLTTSP